MNCGSASSVCVVIGLACSTCFVEGRRLQGFWWGDLKESDLLNGLFLVSHWVRNPLTESST
jgi:hypothetical protein